MAVPRSLWPLVAEVVAAPGAGAGGGVVEVDCVQVTEGSSYEVVVGEGGAGGGGGGAKGANGQDSKFDKLMAKGGGGGGSDGGDAGSDGGSGGGGRPSQTL